MYTENGLNYFITTQIFIFGDAASPAGNLDVSTGMRMAKGDHFFNDKYR
jgi:hypothetical protein